MRIVVTGSNGFIGRNLLVRPGELGRTDIATITRQTPASALGDIVAGADVVFHLAGVNRPTDDAEFQTGNAGLTVDITEALRAAGRSTPMIYASSTQAERDNAYGRSKRAGEEAVERYGDLAGAAVGIFRLTNVFGKWARPNYNSAVATFCHQVASRQALTIHDRSAPLRLVYIDDVITAFLGVMADPAAAGRWPAVEPVYETTVGSVADIIESFHRSRTDMVTPPVGAGLTRALHATYLSGLGPNEFVYSVSIHADPRGVFVEMLKTPDCGQFSYFTAKPGITRGDHYHHSKTEKFLVLAGTARFQFRHVVTGAFHELVTKGGEARIVETVPGWTHNVTNAGTDELVVMLWANKIFDRDKPDTIARKVEA